jgi:hypothetical protein
VIQRVSCFALIMRDRRFMAFWRPPTRGRARAYRWLIWPGEARPSFQVSSAGIDAVIPGGAASRPDARIGFEKLGYQKLYPAQDMALRRFAAVQRNVRN